MRSIWVVFSMGFVVGCGGVVSDSHRLTPANPQTCATLNEVQCIASSDCDPVYEALTDRAPCLCDIESDSCGCPPPPDPQFVECVDQEITCDGLDENTCISTAGCEPIYGTPEPVPCGTDCIDENCSGGFLPCEEYVAPYMGCQEEQFTCPPIGCRLYCENGYATDANGCQICECLPPPTCDGLSEDDCIASPDCHPDYEGDGHGARMPCDNECAPGDPHCYPCEPPPFTCVPVSHCDYLDENACIADPGCDPLYISSCRGAAARECDPDDENCYGDPPCREMFDSCNPL